MNIFRKIFGESPKQSEKPKSSGKSKKREVDAAAEFVVSVCNHVPAQWPSICHEIQSFEPKFASLVNEPAAVYDFTLAVIAVEMRALGHLQADQAHRIRQHVLESLTTPDTGNYPRQMIAVYDEEWESWMLKNEIPIFGVASVLYDKLGLSGNFSHGNDTFKDPLVLSALADAIVHLGGPWWKKYLELNHIIP